ncbi:hypothetical protein ACFE04_023261 [Oxalis oulophora]
MVIFMYAGNRILALKTVLISTAILSMAVLVTILPSLTDFSVFNELVPSSLLNIVSLILRPPYLYIFVNFIIISILASTKLHKPHDHHPTAAVKTTLVAATTIVDDPYDVTSVVYGYGVDVVGQEPISDEGREVEKVIVVDGGDEILKDVVRIDSMEIRVMDEKLELFKQKVKEKEKEKDRPLSSTRFKPDKTGYEGFNGKALRVLSKPKRDDTLESTWRTITDGRSMPLTRHLKKVETWEADAHVQNDKTTPQVKKSETFNTSKDATNSPSNISSSLRREPSLKLKKDPSLSQDELNRRVEAFINKFNEEMRLQRQQSLMNQEMLKYGVMQ